MKNSANDESNPSALPAARCGLCMYYCTAPSGFGNFGSCMVRQGTLPTYTGPNYGCDVNGGRAWSPKKALA